MAHHIIPIPAFNDNYIWLIMHPNNNRCAVVDPGDAQPVLDVLTEKGLNLDAILITHHHWDHTGGIDALVSQYGCPVYGPAHENIAHLTHPLSDNEAFTHPELALSFTALDIPGHTTGHIAYYGEGYLFCGDTLFTGGCGRLFEGTAEQMHHSLSTLAALPSETLVYCGHEYTENNLHFAARIEPHNVALKRRIQDTLALRQQGKPTVPSTLALEKQTNPFLRSAHPDVIAAASQHVGTPLTTPVAVFAALRTWKDQL